MPGPRNLDPLKALVGGANWGLGAQGLAAVEAALPMGWINGDRYSEAQWAGPERYA